MNTRTVTLHDSGGGTLITLLARTADAVGEAPLRNSEGAQPPGANRQGAFGSGIHKVGVLERDLALCDVSSYASTFHAKAALEAALLQVASVRVEGWELPIAAAVGVTEWQVLLSGLRARVRLIPSSAHWRYLASADAVAAASQAGTTITGSGFTAADVGRVIVFNDGSEALITSYASATSVGSDVDQTVSSQAANVYDAATGLL